VGHFGSCRKQTASQTIAQKATAYGFEGVRVDGMDPLSYQVTRDALEKAKNPSNGELRPTLIEAVQYRFGAHTTADDPSVYRESEEVKQWKKKDPIPDWKLFSVITASWMTNWSILSNQMPKNR